MNLYATIFYITVSGSVIFLDPGIEFILLKVTILAWPLEQDG
jgi:hypothetical protein